MTKDIVKVEQTDLAKLVQQRETLQNNVTVLKRRLRELPMYDVDRVKAEMKRRKDNARQQIKDAEKEHNALVEAESEREYLLEIAKNPRVRDLLERDQGKGTYYSWANQIENYTTRIAGWQSIIDEEPEMPVDPHIAITNELAASEQSLAVVKRTIKELM